MLFQRYINLNIFNEFENYKFYGDKIPPQKSNSWPKGQLFNRKKQVRHNNRNLRQDEKNADLDLQNPPVTLDY